MKHILSIALVAAFLSTAASAQQGARPEGQGQQPTQAQPARPAGAATAQFKAAVPGGDLPGDPRIQLVKVAGGLIDPVNVVSARDGSGRMFVVERHGRVMIVKNGQVQKEPFLDIVDKTVSSFLEQGLYDIEFHPDFRNNGFFYVHFAEMMRNGDSMIVRYKVAADSPDRADPNSAKVIMQIEQPYANHNGGELAFGPDGYLYIGSGDGGWEGDPLEAGQNLGTVLGKLLRIDVNTPDNVPYAIPRDNPFVQQTQLVQLFDIPESTFAKIHTYAKPEIWAYGLRNPWKFNFDRQTGDLYIADVGQNHWEEIDFQPAGSTGGQNYGWKVNMGTHCFPIDQTDCPAIGVPPVAEYSHNDGCGVMGLGVYRGREFRDLNGIYFAGDYCSGKIWGLARDNRNQWTFQELLATNVQITGAGEDENGEMYVTSCNCNYGGPAAVQNPPGTLWRLVAANAVGPNQETAGAAQPQPTSGQSQ